FGCSSNGLSPDGGADKAPSSDATDAGGGDTGVDAPADTGGDAPADAPGETGSGDATSDSPTDATSDTTSDAPSLPACSSLPNPLYVMSGDTQVPILKELGKALRQDANPMTIVWQATGSCTIIDAVYNGTPLRQNLSYIPADPSWDPATGTVP